MKKWMMLVFLSAPLLHAQLDTTKWYAFDAYYWLNPPNGWCTNATQAAVAGGYLTLTADYGSNICQGHTTNYNTGAVISNPFYFTYGTVKVRAKFGTTGVHSTVWTWGGGVTSSGYPPTCIASILAHAGAPMYLCTSTSVPAYEIDIAEMLPNINGLTKIRNNAFEWQSGVITVNNSHDLDVGYDLTQAFHIYELDWTPTTLTYKIDGITTTTFSYALNTYMLMILDQEMDASAPPSSSGSYPIQTIFSYVHVYCTADTTYPVGCTPGQAIFSDDFTAGTGTVSVGQANKGAVIQ